MPQGKVPFLTVAPRDTSALQAPITLQTAGNYVLVGAPGGPVAFAAYGDYVLPQISLSPLRTVAKGGTKA